MVEQSATTYTYKVTDANGDEATDEFTIEVTNSTPTLTGTSDLSWVQGLANSVTLPTASGGDAPLTYSLAGLPTGVSFAADTRELSGTTSAAEQSATTYTYKVTDANGDEATDEFTLEITNATPTLGSISDQSWIEGIANSVTLPAATGGDAPLTYSLAGLPTGVTFAAGTRLLSGTSSVTAQSATTYTYKVTDANGDEATAEFTIEIATDTSPSLGATSDQSWIEGVAVSLTLPAATGGNAPLTYSLNGSLFGGASFDTSTRSLSGTPSTASTTTTYTYKVRDADGDEAMDKFTVTVASDTSPSLNAISDQRWIEGETVSLTLPTSTAGNTPLTYSLEGTLPTGVSFGASTRIVSGSATSTQNATTYTFKVRDANGDETTEQFTIAVESDSTPSLASTPDQNWIKGSNNSVTLPAATNGNTPLTYTLSGSLPAGVSFNTSTRMLSGTPSAIVSATTYTYKVRDVNGDEDTDQFAFAVSVLPNLVFAPSRVTVPEGGSSSYTVALSVLPTANVTVAISASGDSSLTHQPTTLNFNTTNWNSPQTVTVSASEDSDGTDGTATLTHTASGGNFQGKTGNVYVSEVDNDRTESDDSSDPCASIPRDLAPTQPPLEGIPFLPSGPSLTSGDGQLRLRVPAASSDALAPVVAWNYKLDHYKDESKPAKWTRVPEVWLMERTIPITVSDQQALPVTNGEVPVAAQSLPNELLFSRTDVPVARGNAASYAVRLATQPTADVTVTISGQSQSDSGLTASPAQLTFSASNWNQHQIMTITAGQAEGEYRRMSFTHLASGGGYDGVSGQVTAQEGDTDAKVLTLTADALEVDEGGTVTYTLHLAARPSTNVLLTVGRTGDADVSVDTDSVAEGDQNTLTFTPTDWNRPRTITVTAGLDENALSETVLLDHSLEGDGYGKRIGGLVNSSANPVCESVYLLSVQAVNRMGVSAFSTAVQATPSTLVPSAPTNLRAEPGAGEITLSWSDPEDATVTGFEYRYTTFSGTAGDSRGLSAWSAIDPTTSHVVKGARFGVRYTFEVRALRGDVRGAVSRATAIPALAEDVSLAPTGFAANWVSTGEALLNWDLENSTVSYEYRYSGDDGVTWAEWQEAVASCDEATCSSTASVNGSPEAYEFELRRRSSLNGDIARARTGTHPGAPGSPILQGVSPDGPSPTDRWQLTWTASTDGEASTAWQYRSVYLGDPNGSLWSAWTDMHPSTDEGVFSFTVIAAPGESKGQRMFQVRGTNPAGAGEPSNIR